MMGKRNATPSNFAYNKCLVISAIFQEASLFEVFIRRMATPGSSCWKACHHHDSSAGACMQSR